MIQRMQTQLQNSVLKREEKNPNVDERRQQRSRLGGRNAARDVATRRSLCAAHKHWASIRD